MLAPDSQMQVIWSPRLSIIGLSISIFGLLVEMRSILIKIIQLLIIDYSIIDLGSRWIIVGCLNKGVNPFFGFGLQIGGK